MSKINNGGPAFPLQSIGPDFAPGYSGMSLRDWFAGQALAGELAAQDGDGFWSDESAQTLAERCYLVADAMLKAKETDQ